MPKWPTCCVSVLLHCSKTVVTRSSTGWLPVLAFRVAMKNWLFQSNRWLDAKQQEFIYIRQSKGSVLANSDTGTSRGIENNSDTGIGIRTTLTTSINLRGLFLHSKAAFQHSPKQMKNLEPCLDEKWLLTDLIYCMHVNQVTQRKEAAWETHCNLKKHMQIKC